MRIAIRCLLAGFFILAGANHFLNKEWYLRIMPAWVPYHLQAVYLSGAAEMLLGAALLHARSRRGAGWGLVGLLLAIFPANLEMALHPERFPAFKPLVLWARLPLQVALIALVLWASGPAQPKLSDREGGTPNS
jgi:uncharacterized membrane protein